MKTKSSWISLRRRALNLSASCAVAFLLTTECAQATQLELIYNGSFNTQNALNAATATAPSYFKADTSFTINAWFDTSSMNFAPPSPPAPPPFAGFRAYAPSVATITIGGAVYTIDTITTNPAAGITVAIFDQNTFTPGRYGIGILQNPPQDGAGFIADFGGASPGFTGTANGSTTFTNFYGVGYSSGICLQGTGGACTLNAVTPLVLHDDSGKAFNLTLGNYSADYSTIYEPGNILGPINSAALILTPEPATCTLMGLSLALLISLAKRRRN